MCRLCLDGGRFIYCSHVHAGFHFNQVVLQQLIHWLAHLQPEKHLLLLQLLFYWDFTRLLYGTLLSPSLPGLHAIMPHFSPHVCLTLLSVWMLCSPLLCLCGLSSFQVSMVGRRSCGSGPTYLVIPQVVLADPYSSHMFYNLHESVILSS